jgi:hypothetical protein
MTREAFDAIATPEQRVEVCAQWRREQERNPHDPCVDWDVFLRERVHKELCGRALMLDLPWIVIGVEPDGYAHS